MAGNHCQQCEQVTRILKQHEHTITQLLEIIAVTNRKLSELDDKYTAHDKGQALQL
ncbi:hypothetical protein [Sediminibacillus albus]|uniref:hypothetical protein n=1 Tax=Sediminibacillus albus TaxID=407036 RepID=UPI001587FFA8|nr:hypothetical protein [Sediminibacillus albus]